MPNKKKVQSYSDDEEDSNMVSPPASPPQSNFINDDESEEYDPSDRPKAARQKKNRRQVEDERLEEDDLALIQENNNKSRPRQKKLKRYDDDEPMAQIIEKSHPIDNFERELKADGELVDDFEKPAVKSRGPKLEDKFIANEVDEYFTSPEDVAITEADVPERLQIKLKGRQEVSKEELQEEAGWIFNQLVTAFNNSAEIDMVKQKICRVLPLFHLEKLDLPVIARYYMDELTPTLDEDKVWRLAGYSLRASAP